MSEQFTTPEQALIERLRRAPQPELSSEARAVIRARVLDALDHPPLPAPRPPLPRPMIVVVAVIIAAALIAGGVLFVLSRQNQTVVTPTLPATFTTVPPSATPTQTATASPTLTPTVVPTASVGVITVVEGPVEHVNGNVITIYGVPVQVDPNDPVLGGISVGDVVRVEGSSQPGTVIIVATTVVVVNVDVNVNPSSGEVWHDDGNCSHPPPDWAPANGWRRRCQGQEKDNDKGGKHDKGDDEGDD